jgi:hypothetical protein
MKRDPKQSEPPVIVILTDDGPPVDVRGRPLAMLKALLTTQDERCTVNDLRKAMNIDEEAVSYPEQVIRDTAKRLRTALKRAWEAARQEITDPLPSIGRGGELTYALRHPPDPNR